VLIGGAQQSRLPPRAEHRLRGRFSDLESLKSGKDRTKTWVRLLFALERTKRDGFAPRAEPPAGQINDRSHAFGTDTLRDAIGIANLLQPNDARYCGL
jgi:hypothetical protein